jgi:hypothetical protein
MRPLNTFTALIWPLALCILPANVVAAECSAKSGTQTVPLLELYTSEGCSSCPATDHWLSGISAAGMTADKVVLLAFHVDYWDYIGWKDRFAKPMFTARQHEVAAHNRASFVYTPQLVFNGNDYRGGTSNSRFAEQIANINRQPARANLGLNLTDNNEVKISVQTRLTKDRDYADVFVAVYENKLKSTVSAGENSGSQLNHDYVVREWYGPFAMDSKSEAAWEHTLPLKSEWKSRDAGVATFVQNRKNGEVLQALSLPFCS